jgi:hypothetical protein
VVNTVCTTCIRRHAEGDTPQPNDSSTTKESVKIATPPVSKTTKGDDEELLTSLEVEGAASVFAAAILLFL